MSIPFTNMCHENILQITLVANNYPALFYIKGAKWQGLIVKCAEIAILETI